MRPMIYLCLLALIGACASSTTSSGGGLGDASTAADNGNWNLGSEVKTTDGSGTSGDTGPSADGLVGDQGGPITGSDGGPGDDVEGNGTCSQPSKLPGTVKAFDGFAAGNKTYGKDTCPGGDAKIAGRWRLVDGNTEDPATVLTGATTAEMLTFDGNTFIDHIAGVDQGSPANQTMTGWYFCADASELASKDYGMHIDTATPSGAFGNSSGDVWFATVLMQGGDQLGIAVSDASDKNPSGILLYCRVGSTINGHCCNDPFAN